MQIFQDIQENESQWDEVVLPIHDFDDCRPAGDWPMDEWVDGGHHLLNSVLFTVKEILSLFAV